MGAEAPLVHHFPDDRRDCRRRLILFPAGPRRGSAFHLQDDDRAGLLARRDDGRDAAAGHRTASSANCRRPRASIFCAATRSPASTTIFVNLKGSTKASDVPDIWYQVRKNVGDIRHTLPAGVVGPGFNDDFGDTFGLIYGFTADGFTPSRAARLCRRHPLAAAAGSRRVEDRAPRRAGRADLRRVFDSSSSLALASTARP